MKFKALLVATISLFPTWAFADDDRHAHEHHEAGMDVAPPDQASINVTINPEARVNVTVSGNLSPSAPCGMATEFQVNIINYGYVTAALEAVLVADPPPGVTIDFNAEPLKGVRNELRKLQITLANPEPTDVTIAFRLHNEIADLGGRDRIHFLLLCHDVHLPDSSILTRPSRSSVGVQV